MNQRKSFQATFSTTLGAVLSGALTVGCIGVSQPKADPSAPSSTALAACPGGVRPGRRR